MTKLIGSRVNRKQGSSLKDCARKIGAVSTRRPYRTNNTGNNDNAIWRSRSRHPCLSRHFCIHARRGTHPTLAAACLLRVTARTSVECRHPIHYTLAQPVSSPRVTGQGHRLKRWDRGRHPEPEHGIRHDPHERERGHQRRRQNQDGLANAKLLRVRRQRADLDQRPQRPREALHHPAKPALNHDARICPGDMADRPGWLTRPPRGQS